MRFFPLITAGALLLTACGSTSLTYNLTFDTQDQSRVSELMAASLRVVERRVASLESETNNLDIDAIDDGAIVTLSVNDEGVAEALTASLTGPFTLRIMQEVPEEGAELVIEGHGGFAGTGLTEEDIDWVEAGETSTGQGRIRLMFTPEGRTKLEQVFAANQGKNIGLFVRDRLIAKLLVNEDIKQDVVISGIPSVDLAEVFADDVNVGLHVTFSPVL